MGAKIAIRNIRYSPELQAEIKASSNIDFEADEWAYSDPHRNVNVRMIFADRFGPFTDIVKTWTYIRLSSGIALGTQKESLRCLGEIMKDTAFLKDSSTEAIIGSDVKARTHRSRVFKSFADFAGEYKDTTKNLKSYITHKDDTMRDLPTNPSWAKMDEVIGTFMATATEEEERFFYPIVIWWKVGTIIPNRPEEFCMIKYDCLKERGEYHYLEVATAKLRANPEPEYTFLPVSKELYDIVDHYKKITSYDKRDQLFSMKEFRRMKSSESRTIFGYNYETLGELHRLFYSEIVEKKMGMTVVPKGSTVTFGDNVIEWINLGDLRPYAIYNMMEQGMDPYAIMKMARHKSISIQTHYYRNMMNMALGRVHAMARRIMMRMPNTVYIKIAGTLEERSLLARQLKNIGGIPMKNGECCYSMNCPPDTSCPMCQHYIPYDPAECKETYDREMKALERCIETMLVIYKERNGRFDELKALSREMNARINRAAMLEARYGQKV